MFSEVTLQLAKGFLETLKLFGLTLVFSLPFGLIISFGSMSKIKPVSYIVKVFVWIIRGTPLMLQLIIICYGPGLLGMWAKGIEDPNFIVSWLAGFSAPDRFLAAVIAFVINYSCYFSEIYRGGIQSISKGQYEAGQVLGLKKSQIFSKIILLQVIKRIIPPMSNEIITLVKDTSLARIIAVYEIIWIGQDYIKTDGIIWPLFYTGAFYLAFSGLLTLLFSYLEKKLEYFRS